MSATTQVEQAIIHACQGHSRKETRGRGFFQRWFFDNGRSYYFLFKKNLKVTNIQFAELLSLIARYQETGGRPPTRLQFVTVQQFNEQVGQLFDAFFPDGPPSKSRAARAFAEVATLYADLLGQTVVVDCFFGSCAVYLPTGLDIDISRICATSGYIHSCGRNIFIRNVTKADKYHFYEDLRRYLALRRKDTPRSAKKLFFAVYAHEDFSRYDRSLESELKNGLDDVKIYVEKFYMGDDRLVSILREMNEEKFSKDLVIPQPGNYHLRHKEARNDGTVDPTRTLWLLVDSSIGEPCHVPGSNRYFICYEQQYINQNPFHIFDENKPAWIAHTTIPHTLAAAMLNIALPYTRPDETVLVSDPFVGSGTVWLEAMKFDDVDITGSDIEPISSLLAKDNLWFFTLNAKSLESLAQKLERLDSWLEGIDYDDGGLRAPYEEMVGLVHQTTDDEATIPEELVKKLADTSSFQRVLFYLGLKAQIRNIAAFEIDARDFTTAYRGELARLVREIRELAKLRSRQDKEAKLAPFAGFVLFQGSYSTACTLSTERLREIAEAEGHADHIKRADATTELPKGRYDIIVTDPPYGFNTKERSVDLARLYRQICSSMLDSLKDDGQLILCLPEASRTGRRSPAFTHAEMVLRQIFVEAWKRGREVVVSGRTSPRPYISQPPYYWESERALRRLVLHLRLRPASTSLASVGSVPMAAVTTKCEAIDTIDKTRQHRSVSRRTRRPDQARPRRKASPTRSSK